MAKQLILAGIFFLIIFVFKVPTEFPQHVLGSNLVSIIGGSSLGNETQEKKFTISEIETHGAYILDISTNKIIYEKNPKDVRPLASLTKLVTGILAEENIKDGAYITISKAAEEQVQGEGMQAGDEYKKEDLIDIMMVASSNDAAYAVAEAISGNAENFIFLMNQKVGSLGFKTLGFSSPHGLDILTRDGWNAGSSGSAEEVGKLFEYVYKNYPSLIAKTRLANFEIISKAGRVIKVKNTNEAFGDIPNLIGSKTGYTAIAGGNLVFIFEPAPGKPVVVSILGSSEKGRFEDARKLVQEISKYYGN